MALNLQHQTPAQFVARFRARYRNSSNSECARLASWLTDRVQAGDLTRAQVQAAFGLSDAQWDTLRTKLAALKSNWVAVQAARGE